MVDAFTPMTGPERAAFPMHYMRYLRWRDGTPCLRSRTLSRREAILARTAPVRRQGAPLVDPTAFARNLAHCAPDPGIDAVTLWALAVAKGNRAERYGVEHKLARRGFEPAGAGDVLTYVEIQECYHTRLLLRALAALGIECDVGAPVGRLTRAGVRLFGQLPRAALDVLALAFEVVGIAAFHAMRAEARELFVGEPGIMTQIDALFGQILVDEVGHVHFLRSRLGPGRLAAARATVPLAQAALFDDNHEIRMLLDRRGALGGIDRMDVDAVVASDPERLPAVGTEVGVGEEEVAPC